MSALAAALLLSTITLAEPESPWRGTTIATCGEHIGGVAAGDLLPDAPGLEVVAVTETGVIWLASRDDAGTWHAEVIHDAPGELIMCAIGDVDRAAPGLELVSVGMQHGAESTTGAGVVRLTRRAANGGWSTTELHTESHMIHGVAIGDVDPRHPGNEIAICSFNHRVVVLALNDDGSAATADVAYVGNDRQKVTTIADIDPATPAHEIAVVGSDGRAVVIRRAALGWAHDPVLRRDAGQSRVAAGRDVVLAGGDDGTVIELRHDDAGWHAREVLTDTAKIRGVARHSTLTWSCGYSGLVLEAHADGVRTIHDDGAPLHHLITAELDGDVAGPELVTAGHAGRIVLLTRHRPE